MNDVLDTIRDWPWGWAWLTFFVVVLLRAGGTYGIGRAVAAGVVRRRPPGPRVQAAMDRVNRWGPPAVTLSFLTVGAQTAVNAAAGLTRMGVLRYLSGLVPGAVLWATVWTTIGMGAFYLALGSGENHLLAVSIAMVAVLVSVVLLLAIRRERVAPAADRDTLDE